jgi:hypothetical protein
MDEFETPSDKQGFKAAQKNFSLFPQGASDGLLYNAG